MLMLPCAHKVLVHLLVCFVVLLRRVRVLRGGSGLAPVQRKGCAAALVARTDMLTH